jgi:hypothetical protein
MLNDHVKMSGVCPSVPHDQADVSVCYCGELDGLVDKLTLMEKSTKIT